MDNKNYQILYEDESYEDVFLSVHQYLIVKR